MCEMYWALEAGWVPMLILLDWKSTSLQQQGQVQNLHCLCLDLMIDQYAVAAVVIAAAAADLGGTSNDVMEVMETLMAGKIHSSWEQRLVYQLEESAWPVIAFVHLS